ncbi:MAG: class I SAM-dependent rRNA methyltransferase [Chloroflexota bacterium]
MEARVILGRGRQSRVLDGHPWVYANEIESIEGQFVPGGIVAVCDARGRFIGRGYINPASQIRVRIMTRNEHEKVDEELFRRRLSEAWAYRQRWVKDSNACRVVFAEADRLPALIVDKFGDYLVVQFLALGMDVRRELIVRLLNEIIKPKGIYERSDVPVRQLEGVDGRTGFLTDAFPTTIEIQENGFRLLVDIEHGQKTGYFLDQRENRAAIAPLMPGARVLDCFSYTGGFAVHCAGYGAREVTAVDASADALAMVRRNAELNGLGDRIVTREANVFDELRRLEAAGEKYDVVLLDPPAFAKNKAALEGAVRGYKEINLRAMHLLPPHSYLVTASCSYHMSEELFYAMVQDAANDSHRRLRLVESRSQAKDHPVLLGAGESRYLKFLILEVI